MCILYSLRCDAMIRCYDNSVVISRPYEFIFLHVSKNTTKKKYIYIYRKIFAHNLTTLGLLLIETSENT